MGALSHNPKFIRLSGTIFCSTDADGDSLNEFFNNIPVYMFTFNGQPGGDVFNPLNENVTIKYPELLNDELYEVTNEFLRKNNLTDFEVIHFRAEPNDERARAGFNSLKTKEIINYWLDRLQPLIDINKTYVLCSNSKMFFDMFTNRYKNAVYLDREFSFYEYEKELINGTIELKKPKLIPDYVFGNDDQPFHHTYSIKFSNYIAFIEQCILTKSKRNIHVCDGYRNMISLFMTYPTLIKSVPITWVTFDNLIERKYTSEGCYYHRDVEELNNKSLIKVPESLCEHSLGKLC